MMEELIITKEATITTDNEGNKYINNYKVLRPLGRGSYSTVELVFHQQTYSMYAMKIINKTLLKKRARSMNNLNSVNSNKGSSGTSGSNNDDRYDPYREIEILKKLRGNENIVLLVEVIDDPNCDKLMMVLEYCIGGSVVAGTMETTPLIETNVRLYALDLLNGLHSIHSQNIIHRDIKPENLLLNKENKLKIADFGVSQIVVENRKFHDTKGSTAFLAPEMLTGEDYDGFPVDVWAAGVTLYIFLFGKPPFVTENNLEIEMYNMIKGEQVKYPQGTNPVLMDMLDKMLEKDPKRRITILQLLQHPWLMSITSSPIKINNSDNYNSNDNNNLSSSPRSVSSLSTATASSGSPLPRPNLTQVRVDRLIGLFADINGKLRTIQDIMENREAKFQELEIRLLRCESQIKERVDRFMRFQGNIENNNDIENQRMTAVASQQ